MWHWFQVGNKNYWLSKESTARLTNLAEELSIGRPAVVEPPRCYCHPEPAPPQDGSFGWSPAMDALDDVRKLQADTPEGAVDLSFIPHRLDRLEQSVSRQEAFLRRAFSIDFDDFKA